MKEAFSKAAKSSGLWGNNFREAILSERPDLQGKTAYFPQQGNASQSVIIGDEIFKRPSSPLKGLLFEEERNVLEQLEGKGLPVPKVTYVGKETVFFGMTVMPGVPLEKGFCDRLTPEEQCSLAKEIVNFIIGFASVLPVKNNEFAVHADLKCENILIDPLSKKLCGVIDFGRISYKPARDLLDNYLGGNSYFKAACAEEFELKKAELPDVEKGVFKAKPAPPIG